MDNRADYGMIGGVMVPHPPLIVPEVGRGGEKIIEETTKAYEKAADLIAALKPDTIVISSPHSILYRDYFHISPGSRAYGDLARFGAAEVSAEVEYDTEMVTAIERAAQIASLHAGTQGERDPQLDHGTMVPLYFILKKYASFKLVRIGLSGFDLETHFKMGKAIAEAAFRSVRRTVFVASGDLSHKLQPDGPYGFDPMGPVYDERIMDVMSRAAFDELFDFNEDFLEQAAECGHRSFVMMAGALEGKSLETECLSHQDVTGVGYGICTYKVVEE